MDITLNLSDHIKFELEQDKNMSYGEAMFFAIEKGIDSLFDNKLAPQMTISNDSIGFYEFQGRKEYDRRDDYLEFDGENEHTFSFPINGIEKDTIDEMLFLLNDLSFGLDVVKDEVEAYVVLNVKNHSTENDTFKFSMEWEVS